jgi:hypothetical protein
MKELTKIKLKEAEDICDAENRSTEYMIEFMQEYAKVSFDCVMNYIEQTWHSKEASDE